MIASAPAKLFLIGEYAVLNGAPAVVAPLPQRAIAERIEDTRRELVMIADRESHQPMAHALVNEPLLKAVVSTLDCAPRLTGSSLRLDTGAFFHAGAKLGLGSSAAMTAALVRLLAPMDTSEDHLIELAIAAHQAFQGGRGSGADIALAIKDTTIKFQAGLATPLNLPKNLHMLAIWTGVSASTTGFINQLEGWREGSPRQYERHMTNLTQIAEDFVKAQAVDSLLSLLNQYDRYLDEFSKDSGLDFYNLPHLRLRKEVELARCVYKPSGAGGGDFGIAFSADLTELTILADKLAQEGRIAFFLNAARDDIQEQ